MKVSIGSRIVDGPWGGGNLFAINLRDYLLKNGHEVIFDLSEKDIDVILLTDPRSKKESSSTFSHLDILKYKKLINPNVTVIQRINECDERKNTQNINKLYLEASEVSDHVIFVSSWLRDIYLKLGLEKSKTSVILAGSNKLIFNDSNSLFWDGKEKLKIVTHHWSSHKNKGFETYIEIDELLNQNYWSERYEFSYIGNLPSNLIFKNTKVFSPLHGKDLADKLKENHVYITASKNEPSGNHHIEAAQCGLPIIYINSGGIPEYSNGYGIVIDDLKDSLEKTRSEYIKLKTRLLDYPFNSEKMCDQFVDIFEKIYQEKIIYQKNKPISIQGKIFLNSIYLRRYFNLTNFLNAIRTRIKKVLKNEY